MCFLQEVLPEREAGLCVQKALELASREEFPILTSKDNLPDRQRSRASSEGRQAAWDEDERGYAGAQGGAGQGAEGGQGKGRWEGRASSCSGTRSPFAGEAPALLPACLPPARFRPTSSSAILRKENAPPFLRRIAFFCPHPAGPPEDHDGHGPRGERERWGDYHGDRYGPYDRYGPPPDRERYGPPGDWDHRYGPPPPERGRAPPDWDRYGGHGERHQGGYHRDGPGEGVGGARGERGCVFWGAQAT